MVAALSTLKGDINTLKEIFSLEKNQLCAILNDLMTSYFRCVEARDVQIKTLNMVSGINAWFFLLRNY